MDKTQTIKASAQTLGLTHTKISLDEIIHTAQENDYSYLDLIGYVLDCEITYRQDKAREKRIKEAGFPYPKYLKDFDLSFCKAISKKQFKQLSELAWIDGIYNLILSGPPGVGKTHLAIGLGYQACEEGYDHAVPHKDAQDRRDRQACRRKDAKDKSIEPSDHR